MSDKQQERVKILICTANMGNQPPDADSLAAWIPKDGEVDEVVVDNPQYPIRKHLTSGANKFKMAVSAFIERKYNVDNQVEKIRQFATASASKQKAGNDTSSRRKREMERFDIIVIGMQESTWHRGNSNSQQDNNNNYSSEFEELFEQHVKKRIAQPTQIIRKSVKAAKAPIGKSIQAAKAVKTLTMTDKDHMSTKRDKSRRGGFSIINNTSKEEPEEQLPSEETAGTGPSNQTQAKRDTSALHKMLRQRLPSYTHELSYQRGEMRLMVFYLDFQCDLQVLSVKAQNTGRAGLANKGGIIAEVLINSGTRIAFMTAHLEAHEGESKYETRCNSVSDILRGTASSTTVCRCDAAQASHYMFAFGDLNFRTRLPGIVPASTEHITGTNALVAQKDWETLNRRDELYMALRQKDCFVGFQTPICWFPPTFKVARGKGYEYNEKRSPSYTDRILYRASDQLGDNIKVLAYEPIDNFVSSDHKPLRGAFQLQLNESLKWKPTLGQRAAQMRQMVKRNARSLCIVIKDGNIILGRKRHQSSKYQLQADDSRENLHMFVSSISCTLEKTKDDYLPSPYVCFMSTPAEAIQRDKSKMDSLRKALKINARKQVKGDDGRITRSDAGFPRTRCIRNNCFPQWRDEEIHFKVKSHDATGKPVDLSGSMMHIAVMDSKANSRMIGSFTLNLAHLITTTRTKNGNAPKTPTTAPATSGFFAAMKFLALAKNVTSRSEDIPRGSGHGSTSIESPRTARKLLNLATPRTPRRIFSKHRNQDQTANQESDGLRDISESAPYPEITPQKSAERRETSESGISESVVSDDDDEEDDEFNVETSRVATRGPSDALRRVISGAPVSLSSARNQARAALMKRASSTRSVFSSRAPEAEQALDEMNIQSLKVKEPLLKNGRSMGTICMTIDAFWINDKDAESERLRREGNETVATIKSASPSQ